MRRKLAFLPSLIATAAFRVILAGAVSGAGQHTLAQAQAAGWDCDPLVLIGGHYHCSPPGKPGVQDIIDGTATSPSIVHQVFRPDGTYAGDRDADPRRPVRRAALPDRPVAAGPPWLPTPMYYACHHFAFTP